MPLEVYVARVLSAEGRAERAGGVGCRRWPLPSAPSRSSTSAAIRRTASTSATPRTARCCAPRRRGLAARGAGDGRARPDVRRRAGRGFYSASCGGHTERAADVWPKVALFPYLHAVEDDVHDERSVLALERTLDEVRDALARAGVTRPHASRTSASKRAPHRAASGRVGLPGLDARFDDQQRVPPAHWGRPSCAAPRSRWTRSAIASRFDGPRLWPRRRHVRRRRRPARGARRERGADPGALLPGPRARRRLPSARRHRAFVGPTCPTRPHPPHPPYRARRARPQWHHPPSSVRWCRPVHAWPRRSSSGWWETRK